MPGFQRTVTINRPAEQVFDFFTDLKNISTYMPSVTKAEMVTEGGMKPGAKISETRRMKGRENTAVIEITEHERPRLHTASAGMMGFRATYRFRFAPDGQGTRVDMEALIEGNFLWWLFLGMMTRMMEKEDGEMLTLLKKALATPQP
jgi:carbon monoxide dehydrogenase subunit G